MFEFSCSEKTCYKNDRNKYSTRATKRPILVTKTCYVKIKEFWYYGHIDAENGEIYLDTIEMRNLADTYSDRHDEENKARGLRGRASPPL